MRYRPRLGLGLNVFVHCCKLANLEVHVKLVNEKEIYIIDMHCYDKMINVWKNVIFFAICIIKYCDKAMTNLLKDKQ